MLNALVDVLSGTVYPKKYAHGFCFAVLCCGYTLTDFPISIRLTSLALWQSNDCPSASKATLMNMDKYLMWIHYEGLHNHNKAKHNKTVCIFLGIYCKKSCSKCADKGGFLTHVFTKWTKWLMFCRWYFRLYFLSYGSTLTELTVWPLFRTGPLLAPIFNWNQLPQEYISVKFKWKKTTKTFLSRKRNWKSL